MKKMVILAALVASLLVLTGAAFGAVTCSSGCPGYLACYNVSGTDLTNSANSFTQFWSICFVSSVAAYVCNTNANVAPLLALSTFPEGLTFHAVSWDSSSHGAHMQFNRSGDIFNGLYYDGSDRFLLHAVERVCID
jgi:hypothetical protein